MSVYISLLKYRVYRMSSDERFHTVMDLLEKYLIENQSTENISFFLREVDAFCQRRADPPGLRDMEDFLGMQGFCVGQELTKRMSYKPTGLKADVQGVVHIVGAPRSGTSYLYYILAHNRHCLLF